MDRLTERHVGVAVFKDKHNLKAAAEKLAAYEETGCTPEEVASLKEFDNSNTQKYLQEIAKHRWNPIEEHLPSDDRYILLSFENFSLPMVGRFTDNAFYLGDCDGEDTCSADGLFVNAWMELPDPYKPEGE